LVVSLSNTFDELPDIKSIFIILFEVVLVKSFVTNCCSTDLFDSKSSKRDQIKTGDDFAVPGPDRVKTYHLLLLHIKNVVFSTQPQPIYYTNWRQSPPIPPRRGRHYDISKG
jgi:hypothetical protein